MMKFKRDLNKIYTIVKKTGEQCCYRPMTLRDVYNKTLILSRKE